MSGNYPDPPAPRMAYDRDGTQAYMLTGNPPSLVNSPLTGAQLIGLNSEKITDTVLPGGNGLDGGLVFIFPEARDLKGIYLPETPQTWRGVETSVNTTNGIDGTWVALPGINAVGASLTAMRTAIASVNVPGIKAVRFLGLWYWQNPWAFAAIHLYGQPSASASRLEFWHPTLDQSINVTPALLDWGNRPRGSTATKTVRIKNLSSTLTASSIVVGAEALSDASPTYVSQQDFSLDGTNFSPTVVIGSLAPGAISPVVTVRQTLLTTAVLSLWWQRYYANAGSWA